MTVVLTGRDLTRDEVVRVAREGETVELAPEARERMARMRGIVRATLARGDAVYGSNTAVGVLKRVPIQPGETDGYAAWMLRHHIVGQGPDAAADVVRATMLRLANHLAEGSAGVRPELADRLVTALNDGETPRIRTIGSVGQADLAPLAELADALFQGIALEAGEGTALLDNNAFSTGWAALAVSDAATLLDTMEIAGALSLEGLAANPTMLHPAIADVRPYPGIRRTLDRLRDLLAGSAICDPGGARNLQDPLSFRNLPQIQGACRDVLDHVDAQLAIELNASQGNPIVVPDEERVVSVANFEILPLAAALDYLRIVLATALTTSAERTVKALGTPWSGLPTGLTPVPNTAEAGLTYLSLAAQSLAVEARLLAQPVSFELTSTAHAEGIEDRTTMAPLAARRVAEMTALGGTITAIELAVGAQAVELRGLRQGRGTARATAAVRRVVPYLRSGDHVPDVTALADAVRDGSLSREVVAGETAGVDGA
ncbi:MAG TPA: aromatic amino acid ammonia-lyase [Candidatus Limnocylindrales bacterium]|nr:aromatic amino acid ammonia-lyase [Candidatus Limnocylindrales bacterium]